MTTGSQVYRSHYYPQSVNLSMGEFITTWVVKKAKKNGKVCIINFGIAFI